MGHPTPGIRYAVSLEACHILSREKADALAEIIRDRMSDIDEDVYVCVSQYELVQARPITHPTVPDAEIQEIVDSIDKPASERMVYGKFPLPLVQSPV